MHQQSTPWLQLLVSLPLCLFIPHKQHSTYKYLHRENHSICAGCPTWLLQELEQVQSGVLSTESIALPLNLISNAKLHPQQSLPNVQNKSGLFLNALISPKYLPSLSRHIAERARDEGFSFVHNQVGRAIWPTLASASPLPVSAFIMLSSCAVVSRRISTQCSESWNL